MCMIMLICIYLYVSLDSCVVIAVYKYVREIYVCVCVKMENCNYACCAAFIHCVFVFILYKFPFHHFYMIHPSISTHFFFHPSFLYTIHSCTWHLFPFRFIQTYSHIPVSSACKKERFTSWQTMNGLIFTFIYKSHHWHSSSDSLEKDRNSCIVSNQIKEQLVL